MLSSFRALNSFFQRSVLRYRTTLPLCMRNGIPPMYTVPPGFAAVGSHSLRPSEGEQHRMEGCADYKPIPSGLQKSCHLA